MEMLQSCTKPSIDIILISIWKTNEETVHVICFVCGGNIAPVGGEVLHLYIRDVSDISNLRIHASGKSSMGHVVTWFLLDPYHASLSFSPSQCSEFHDRSGSHCWKNDETTFFSINLHWLDLNLELSWFIYTTETLQEHSDISNHQQLECLFRSFFRVTTKESSKPYYQPLARGIYGKHHGFHLFLFPYSII